MTLVRSGKVVVLALALTAMLAPATASAAVRCVDIDLPECTPPIYGLTGQAIAAADEGDTIRFGEGAQDPVNTLKVLTYVGSGSGTPESDAGATIITGGDTDDAFSIPNGGTLRSLRARGGDGPSLMTFPGAGISFSPSVGGRSLSLTDVVALGGLHTSSLLAGPGLVALSTASPISTVTVGGGALVSGQGGRAGYFAGEGIEASLTDALLQAFGNAPGSGGIIASAGTVVTAEGVTSVGGAYGAHVQSASLEVVRSRLTGERGGMLSDSGASGPVAISVRNSLVISNGAPGTAEGAASLIANGSGHPGSLEAVGSTFIARAESPAAVLVSRASDADPDRSVTLRNSIARMEGVGTADLLADRAGIDVDFSSFTTREVLSGASIPAPGSASNVSGDPLLAGGFALQPGSPLIDRADPAALTAGELDLAGNPRSLDGNGDCSPLPDIGAFERPNLCVLPDPPNDAPSLTDVKATNKVFAPVKRGGRITAAQKRKRKVKRGTRFLYTLSEPARVQITIERALRGRRKGKRCRKPTPRNRRGKRCTRYKRVTTLSASRPAGAGSTPFTGRVKRKALKPGRLRASLVAIDAQGARSQQRRLKLRVVRG